MTDADLLHQRHAVRGVFGALLALPQPAIAAVHGFALGGGCELALSCDLVVADATATFGLPEVTVGLVPGGGGTQLALRRLGPGRAADLVLTGRKVGIDEADRRAVGRPAGGHRRLRREAQAGLAGAVTKARSAYFSSARWGGLAWSHERAKGRRRCLD